MKAKAVILMALGLLAAISVTSVTDSTLVSGRWSFTTTTGVDGLAIWSCGL